MESQVIRVDNKSSKVVKAGCEEDSLTLPILHILFSVSTTFFNRLIILLYFYFISRFMSAEMS